jgi:ubiquinol-cytochrome c reductase cytochrome c1 subunit
MTGCSQLGTEMMKTFSKLVAAAGFVVLAAASPGLASGSGPAPVKNVDYSFEGPFGTFDRGQLQRGYQVYTEVCAACHSMNLLAYRNLGDPGGPEFPEDQVKAFAAFAEVTGGPNDDGEMFERPGIPADRFKAPFANEKAARAANDGAYPPDLSLLAKARAGYHGIITQLITGSGGPEYIYSVLTGYQEPDEHATKDAPEGKSYNPYFEAGPWISMAAPLSDDQIEYSDGTAATADQMAQDVSAFLMWAAEPKMEARKSLGLRVLIFLLILGFLVYLTKKKIWRDVEH